MNKLSKEQVKRRDDLAAKLTDAFTKLEGAVTEYNAVVEEANALITEVHDDMDNYHGEKSDKWQESDKGGEYSAWMTEWEMELDPVDGPDDNPGERLADLPVAPE